MGGEGPYVRFSSSRSTSWADHTGLAQLSDEELEAAYSRAGDFLKERKKELTDEHGWSAQPEDDVCRALKLLVDTHDRHCHILDSIPRSHHVHPLSTFH